MNTMKKALSCGLALLVLAGCKDASAALPNAGETIVTIGSKTITKGILYDTMFASLGSNTAITDAMNSISEKEVELTDEMKTEAQNQLDSYKLFYSEQFSSLLTQMNITEEEYLDKVLLPGMRSQKLTQTYVEQNYDAICASYKPIQAIVLSFSSEADASAAISALKDGSASAAEAASANNSTSTGTEEIITIESTNYDTAALTVIRSMSPDDGWTEIPSSDGATFYVLKVVSNDPQQYKEAAVQSLANLSSIADYSNDYFLRKYNFHVYDIGLYNALKRDSLSYALVQDSKPLELPAPAAEETAAPAEETAAPAEESAAPAEAQ